jgi:hypothetical protein
MLGIRAAGPRFTACFAELTGAVCRIREITRSSRSGSRKDGFRPDLLFEQWNKHGVARFRLQRAPVFFDRRSS